MAEDHQEKEWMSFHFHKERKKVRLIELANRYGYEYRIHGDKIRIRGELPKQPGAFMFNWTAVCLREFIDELKHWDGSIGKTAVSISSTDYASLEWYQTLGRLVGVGGNIQKPHTSGFGSTVFVLQQNKRVWLTGNSVTHTKEKVENTEVYCPTVQSSWFYVRRNGKPVS